MILLLGGRSVEVSEMFDRHTGLFINSNRTLTQVNRQQSPPTIQHGQNCKHTVDKLCRAPIDDGAPSPFERGLHHNARSSFDVMGPQIEDRERGHEESNWLNEQGLNEQRERNTDTSSDLISI